MTTITLESIKAEHAKLADMIDDSKSNHSQRDRFSQRYD